MVSQSAHQPKKRHCSGDLLPEAGAPASLRSAAAASLLNGSAPCEGPAMWTALGPRDARMHSQVALPLGATLCTCLPPPQPQPRGACSIAQLLAKVRRELLWDRLKLRCTSNWCPRWSCRNLVLLPASAPQPRGACCIAQLLARARRRDLLWDRSTLRCTPRFQPLRCPALALTPEPDGHTPTRHGEGVGRQHASQAR